MLGLVPLRYTLRSLWSRPSATLLTVLSLAATAGVLAGVLCLQQGFAGLFVERGREDLAVLLRPGANSEGESAFQRRDVDFLRKSVNLFAADAEGRPLVSGELFLAVRRFKTGGGETNVPIRGVQRETFAIHGDDVQIVEGRRLEFGADEVVVGAALTDRIRNCRVGDVLQVNTVPFRVVGVMAGKGPQNSEIWGDVERVMEALERPVFSRVIGVLRDDATVDELTARLEADEQTKAKALTEREYLGSQTGALSVTFLVMGALLAAVMGIGALFTGINSMLAAIGARTHEIGVLKSVGYRPFAIFASFVLESLFLGILGGAVGLLAVIPLQGLQTGTTNFQTFTEIAFSFRLTPFVVIVVLAFSAALGLVGGALPALRAARLPVTDALRR